MEEGHFVVRAEIPGIDPAKDVEITTDHGQLTIKAKRTVTSESKGRPEFCYGSFVRFGDPACQHQRGRRHRHWRGRSPIRPSTYLCWCAVELSSAAAVYRLNEHPIAHRIIKRWRYRYCW